MPKELIQHSMVKKVYTSFQNRMKEAILAGD